MQVIELNRRTRRPSRLAPRACGDVYALMQDRFQSPRARKRALALILIDQGIGADVVHRRTGLGVQSQLDMLKRLSAHGVQAAIFGLPRRLDQRRYNVKAIAAVMRSCLGRCPPDGAMSWNLVQLTTAVRGSVAGAGSITKETVRYLLKNELGISSILDVDPYWVVQIRQQNTQRHEHRRCDGGAKSGNQNSSRDEAHRKLRHTGLFC